MRITLQSLRRVIHKKTTLFVSVFFLLSMIPNPVNPLQHQVVTQGFAQSVTPVLPTATATPSPTPTPPCTRIDSVCIVGAPANTFLSCQNTEPDCETAVCVPYSVINVKNLPDYTAVGRCLKAGEPTPAPALGSSLPPTPVPPPIPCNNGQNPCQTAIGYFDTKDPQYFIKQIYNYLLGLAGAIGFLLLVYAGYVFMTSGGDKQKVQASRETITAVITGILFIIFSVAIIEFLGVSVLQIPGFGG